MPLHRSVLSRTCGSTLASQPSPESSSVIALPPMGDWLYRSVAARAPTSAKVLSSRTKVPPVFALAFAPAALAGVGAVPPAAAAAGVAPAPAVGAEPAILGAAGCELPPHAAISDATPALVAMAKKFRRLRDC